MDIKIPKDIGKYKSKVIQNLTLRQAVSLVASVFLSGAFYFAFKGKINEEILSWLVMLIAVPILAVGYVEYNGMSLEKYVFIVIRNVFIYPTTRKYKEINELEVFLNVAKKERERETKLQKQSKRREKK